jgi:hypothetical protein
MSPFFIGGEGFVYYHNMLKKSMVLIALYHMILKFVESVFLILKLFMF